MKGDGGGGGGCNSSVVEWRTHDRKVSGSSPTGVASEFSSSGSTVCALISVAVPPPCYRSSTKETPIILPKVPVTGYS